jgi:hypothetical protein
MDEDIKTWLNEVLNDPVASILLKYSNLTKTQFETVIIDLITEHPSTNGLRYEDKANMRERKVSRGAFNRSLNQARKNIISSVYTVLLLSYIGLFSGPLFEDYENLAEKLREYTALHRTYEDNPRARANLLLNIEKELLEGIEKLAKPGVLKPP